MAGACSPSAPLAGEPASDTGAAVGHRVRRRAASGHLAGLTGGLRAREAAINECLAGFSGGETPQLHDMVLCYIGGGADSKPLTRPTTPPRTCPIIHTAPSSATMSPESH